MDLFKRDYNGSTHKYTMLKRTTMVFIYIDTVSLVLLFIFSGRGGAVSMKHEAYKDQMFNMLQT